jgi:hypothetical protein
MAIGYSILQALSGSSPRQNILISSNHALFYDEVHDHQMTNISGTLNINQKHCSEGGNKLACLPLRQTLMIRLSSTCAGSRSKISIATIDERKR